MKRTPLHHQCGCNLDILFSQAPLSYGRKNCWVSLQQAIEKKYNISYYYVSVVGGVSGTDQNLSTLIPKGMPRGSESYGFLRCINIITIVLVSVP